MTELALRARSAAGVRLVRRFSPVKANRAFWAALWVAAAAGTAGSLALFVVQRNLPVDPVQVVLRLVGASFAACGLVAWRRRPDNRSGLLMTAAGSRSSSRRCWRQLDHPVARTLALWLPDLWLLFFVPLVLTLLTGGRLRTGTDRVIVGAVLVERRSCSPRCTWCSARTHGGQPLAAHPRPGARGRDRHPQRGSCSSPSRSPPRPSSALGGGGRRRRAARAAARRRRARPACWCSRRCWSSSS